MRHNAILNIHSNVTHIYGDNEAYDENHDLVELDEEKVEAETERLLAEYDAQEYARNRMKEYDALNQFELISDDDANGTTTHKDAIAAIKTKWPKDNSGPK